MFGLVKGFDRESLFSYVNPGSVCLSWMFVKQMKVHARTFCHPKDASGKMRQNSHYVCVAHLIQVHRRGKDSTQEDAPVHIRR